MSKTDWRDLASYAKAQAAAAVPGLVVLAYTLTPWSEGGAWGVVTGSEWGLIAAAAGLSGGVVWGIPNKDPKGKHQDESVQPPKPKRRTRRNGREG